MTDDAAHRWNARHAAAVGAARAPAALVTECAQLLPTTGRGVDVAGGRGRHALWMARRGLDTTLVDVSTVALDIAAAAATAQGLSLRTEQRDLERSGPPPTVFDFILVVDYLHRPLLGPLAEALRPGGVLMVVHPTMANLRRHPHPSARFLLHEGELGTLLAKTGLRVLQYDEGLRADGRHVARIVASRPGEYRTHTGGSAGSAQPP